MANYYYYLTNYHHRHRHIKRLKRLIVGIVVVICLIAGLIVADIVRGHIDHKSPISQQSTVIQEAPITVLSSQYFEFQAPLGWVETINNATPSGEYIYRNLANGLVNQEIDVYVNTVPEFLTAEYVLPVTISSNDTRLIPGQVSGPCSNVARKGYSETSQPIVYMDVSFNCHVDGTDYAVIIGLKGGGTKLILKRADGTTASYVVVYRDLTANPGPGQAAQIISTFEAR